MKNETVTAALAFTGADIGSLRTGLTLDDIAHPAYMVNYNFDLTWYNEPARRRVLGFDVLPHGTQSRNVFNMLERSLRQSSTGRRELIRLYVSLAKPRVTREGLLAATSGLGPEMASLTQAWYDKPGASRGTMVVDIPCCLEQTDGAAEAWQVYGVYFREGVLVIHVPAGKVDPDILEFISRRDIVVRNLMRKQLPVFTSYAVLTAGLRAARRVRSELPLERYFQLMQDIRAAMMPALRKHRGTCGQHVQDGVQYTFRPGPDNDHIQTAEACAREMRRLMAELTDRWRAEMPALGGLMLDTRVTEEQGWLQQGVAAGLEPVRSMHDRPVGTAHMARGQTLQDIKALGAKLMARQHARNQRPGCRTS